MHRKVGFRSSPRGVSKVENPLFEGLFKRTTLSDRQERAVRKTLQNLRAQRRNRFRILACIDGSEEALVTVRFAARLAPSDECDIIVLYVRPVDQGLWSGGLQVKLARQNMMEAGFELPRSEERRVGKECRSRGS